jgi:protein phosphatase
MSRVRLAGGEVYIIADGMGGHQGGALAAELTVRGLEQHLREAPPGVAVTEALREAFAKVNALVYERAHAGDAETQGMGSTAVVLVTVGSVAHLAHVGDSRAYLYRQGRLRQLTVDHTRVQWMVEGGMLTAAEAREHPEASLLYRAIGQKPDIEVDIQSGLPLEEGDGILLCSDGLSGYVDDRELEAVLRSGVGVQEVAGRLVELALAKGGQDNVTVQFIQFGKRNEIQRKNKRPWYQITATVIVVALLTGLMGFLYLRSCKKPGDESYLSSPSTEERGSYRRDGLH